MKITLFFSVIVIVLCSCSEPKVEKRIYNEKDIEGYWATNNAIHGTYWLDSLTTAEGAISDHFLRFYNDVCGVQDTVYKVSGDTILVSDFEYISGELRFVPKYIIEFVAKDRIILKEIKSNIEITYYSLYEVPESNVKFDTIRSIPPSGGLGIEFTHDSLKYYAIPFEKDYQGCVEYIPHTNAKVDERTSKRIDELYARINSQDVLFARSRSTNTLRIDDVVMHVVPLSYTLEMHGDRGLEVIGSAAYISNPFIRAIYWEVGALQSHQVREYKTKQRSE